MEVGIALCWGSWGTRGRVGVRVDLIKVGGRADMGQVSGTSEAEIDEVV